MYGYAQMDTSSRRIELAVNQQIRAELAARRMTQAELAEAVGTGPDVINRYLMGHRSMNNRTFFKIAEALGLRASTILGRAQERMEDEVEEEPPAVPHE